jgi:hypothetical protein
VKPKLSSEGPDGTKLPNALLTAAVVVRLLVQFRQEADRPVGRRGTLFPSHPRAPPTGRRLCFPASRPRPRAKISSAPEQGSAHPQYIQPKCQLRMEERRFEVWGGKFISHLPSKLDEEGQPKPNSRRRCGAAWDRRCLRGGGVDNGGNEDTPSPRRPNTAAATLGSAGGEGDQSPCSRWPEPMEERTRGRKRRRRGGDFFGGLL